jgi:hypothetical protein
MRSSCSESDDLETIPLTNERDRNNVSAPRPASSAQSRLPSPVPTARLSATFTRIIDVHPAQLRGLPMWWTRRARRGGVRVHRLSLEAPRIDAGGTLRMQGRLRASPLGRTIPVELTLWPWLGEWTKLSLEPRRHVVMTRSYFRRGHRTLDRLSRLLADDVRLR